MPAVCRVERLPAKMRDLGTSHLVDPSEYVYNATWKEPTNAVTGDKSGGSSPTLKKQVGIVRAPAERNDTVRSMDRHLGRS